MIRYKIASLAQGRTKGTRVIMAPIQERLVAYKAYRTALRSMVRALADETRRGIIPAYRVDRLTRDVDKNTFARIRALALSLARVTGQTVERILRLESIRNTEAFIGEARKAIGVDITAVVKAEDLEDYLRVAVARNTSLITSLADDVVKRVEQTVIANELNGRSVKTLQSALTEQFGVIDSRARLIARDQTAKLNSDINRIRQEQAGIDRYAWSTAADERVRPLHQALSGREYKWGEATGAEGGLPPGQPIQCRCVGRGIVEF